MWLVNDFFLVEEKKKEQDPSRMTDLVDNDLFAFDDDVFTASKEKQEISISNIEYQAKIDTDGLMFTRCYTSANWSNSLL